MRLVWVALAWAIGIAAAAALPRVPIALWIGAAALGLIARVIVGRAGSGNTARLLTLCVIAYGLGGWRFAVHPDSAALTDAINVGGLTIEGVIVMEPDLRDTAIGLTIDVETITRAGETIATRGRALADAPRTLDVKYGDRVQATGYLRDPGESDAFSYRDYLARQDVYAVMPRAEVVVMVDEGAPPLEAIARGLLDLKMNARRAIQSGLPEPAAGLLVGILLGDERGMAPEVEDAFNATGAAHVIAISGYNLALLGGAAGAILRRLLPNRPGWAAVIALLLIGVYTLFVGAGAGVVRAAIMTALLLIAPLLRRRPFVPASLAFTALIFSVLHPPVLWDLGFQLSFLAVMGLAVFSAWLTRAAARVTAAIFAGRPRAIALSSALIAEPLATGMAAQALTLPIIALAFGRLSLASIPVNLLIAPVQPLILLIGGLAAMVSVLLTSAAPIVFALVSPPLAWTLGVVRAFASLPIASIPFTIRPHWVIGAFALALLIMAGRASRWLTAERMRAWLTSRGAAGALIAIAAALITLSLSTLAARPDGRLHVWLLDVDGGHGVLVRTPHGAHWLIDGGRSPSRLLTALGERLAADDRAIDLLVVTQPDEAAYAALIDVMARYEVGAVITNGQPNLSETYAGLTRAVGSRPIVTVGSGWTVKASDGVRLEVLHPAIAPTLLDNIDDAALVLRLRYGDFSLVIPSGLSGDVQEAISGGVGRATALVLPSSAGARSLAAAFWEQVQPQIVLAHIERGNARGDPDPGVLAMIDDMPLYRTDADGTIHLTTDGVMLWIAPERERVRTP